MFLGDLRTLNVVDLEIIDKNKLHVRQRRCQELRKQFLRRFRQKYLGQLAQKHDQTECVCVIHKGDIVLIGTENVKRANWPNRSDAEAVYG